MRKKIKVLGKSKKSVIVDAPELSLGMKGKKGMNSMRAMMEGDSSVASEMVEKKMMMKKRGK